MEDHEDISPGSKGDADFGRERVKMRVLGLGTKENFTG
jgi:hypothetical protein